MIHGESKLIIKYTWDDSDAILSAIINAAMLEALLLQQYNVVNYVCSCVELYASRDARSADNLGKTVTFPQLTYSLFMLSIPPTWRRVLSMTSMTSHATHVQYV